MSKPPAHRVDAVRLAAEGASLERRFSLAGFPRLADALTSPAGEAVARFTFAHAAEGVSGCELEVEATLVLRCQRCLQPCEVVVHSAGRVALAASDEEAARVPEGLEALTVDPRALDLHELVEDELLLSMPLVPRHGDDVNCAPGATAMVAAAPAEEDEARAATRPFAVLKDLLKH